MTGAGPRVSWAAVDEVCQALERHGFHRAAGPLPDRVITLVQALADTYTASPEQSGPYAAQSRIAGPRPGESVPGSPGDLMPQPARGVAGWGGEPASVRAAYDRQVAAGEPGPPAEGMGVDL